jgi:hypothetical protein
MRSLEGRSYRQAIAALLKRYVTSLTILPYVEIHSNENKSEAIAKNKYTPAQLRLEAALCAFLSAIRDTGENTPEYQNRVAALLNELNQATYFLRYPNLYRITVRDQAGTLSSHDKRAVSLFESAQNLDEESEIVKIERIDPFTGEVLGGFYLE